MRGAVPVLIIILLLAGCTNSESPPAETDVVETDSSTTEIKSTSPPSTTTPAPTQSRTTIPTTRQVETPESVNNPWKKEPVVIGIRSNSARNHTNQAIRAVDYWMENDDSSVDWEPKLVVKANSGSPDVEIRFVDSIESCGGDHSEFTIGCAPILSAESHPLSPEVVQIQDGLTNESTYRTIRHELGHVLGLEHGEGPDGIMAPYDQVYNSIYRVHIGYDNTATYDQRVTRTEVRHALDYYTEGADGHVEENIAFAIIDDPAEADIIINFVDVTGDDGSVARYDGGVFVIEVDGISLRKRGWHVGAWLGFFFGAESTEELPPPFDEPNADPREQWWR